MDELRHELIKRRIKEGASAVELATELGVTTQCVYIMNQYQPKNGKRGRKPANKEVSNG